MSDERDSASTDAATDAGDTVVATGGVTRPKRPSGKRSRQLAQHGDVAASADAEIDVTGAGKEAKKAKNAKVKADRSGPSRNPILFVYNYLKQVVNELRKVIWPNRKQMITYTSVVLAFLVFMVTLVSVSDFGLAKLVMLIFGQNS